MSETMPLNSEKFRKYRRQSRVKAVKGGSKEKNIIISDHPRVNINDNCGDTHLMGVGIRWPFLLFLVFLPVFFLLCGCV